MNTMNRLTQSEEKALRTVDEAELARTQGGVMAWVDENGVWHDCTHPVLPSPGPMYPPPGPAGRIA
jgi:hypothetical protein